MDIMKQMSSAGEQQPTSKRQRLADGLQEGQPVRLQAGVSVSLQPAGHMAPAPFGGEMPAELASNVPWLLSHLETLADGSCNAHIMSLPCAIDVRRYPLFYFFGM